MKGRMFIRNRSEMILEEGFVLCICSIKGWSCSKDG